MRAAPVVVLFALLAATTASGGESTSRIVDRTVVCTPFGEGHPDPVRVIGATAAARFGRNAPTARIDNGYREDEVSAGFQTGPYYEETRGALWLSRSTCAATTRRVALSSSGLRGGRVETNTPYKCDVPARILLRVRAVFTRPVTLARDPRLPWRSVARGTMTAAYLAARTLDGRPLVFASVADPPGSARLFTSRSLCRPR